ncbi:MAG TPA: hypothetical protein VGM73_11545 [Candidatus Didemnitutus sp.]|jgi:peptidoglycan/xylan/chitin deacetylase (PgdA/CDA1 family)
MIGLEVGEAERGAASEFFELFKTPWEFARPGSFYEVLIRTAPAVGPVHARLVIEFAPAAKHVAPEPLGIVARFGPHRFCLYEGVSPFSADAGNLAVIEATNEPLTRESQEGPAVRVQIGYRLFAEVSTLLRRGQPPERSRLPTLEIHIELLRTVITRSGIPLVEIPPIPAGHEFMVCLSHDMDHPSLRPHLFDHTMFGLVQRATVGSLIALAKGRIPFRRAARNFATALALPLVYLRLLPDEWLRFDRYLVIERGKSATYFFIPRRGYAGRTRQGAAPRKRAARYTLESVREKIRLLTAHGNEVGLHGLDAWLEERDGRSERALVSALTGREPSGIRMHWLYFDEGSPAALESAGFGYDSTVGYNRTIGFRAGTTQAFQPPGVSHLLELPLHVMDTALFYPEYLNLTDDQAVDTVAELAGQFAQFGGALTVNWHDRSIAPERQWDEAYERILRLLEGHGAWFPSCGQAVAWFRQRRETSIEETVQADGRRRIRVRLDKPEPGPNLGLRVHRPLPAPFDRPLADRPAAGFEDIAITGNFELFLAS